MKILHIDDEPHILNLIKLILESEGIEVDIECNPRSGLRKAINNSYDLILLDLMMIGLTGFEVAERIRAANIKTPIMILSAKNQMVDKFKSINVGVDDYMVKPFEPNELIRRIKMNVEAGKNG